MVEPVRARPVSPAQVLVGCLEVARLRLIDVRREYVCEGSIHNFDSAPSSDLLLGTVGRSAQVAKLVALRLASSLGPVESGPVHPIIEVMLSVIFDCLKLFKVSHAVGQLLDRGATLLLLLHSLKGLIALEDHVCSFEGGHVSLLHVPLQWRFCPREDIGDDERRHSYN